MAVSETSIDNLALQKLGAAPITAPTDNSKNAKLCLSVYEIQRDVEMAKYLWNFAKVRVQLAPLSVAPLFTYKYAFQLPSDCLRPILPARLGLDWHFENQAGQKVLLTNDGATINFRYIAKVTDTTLFDPNFVEMLACKIAWSLCEAITNSSAKKQAIMLEYKEHRAEARRTNAFQVANQPEPIDSWLASREVGQLVTTDWNEE